MNVTLTLTESEALAALRSFLVSILPNGTEVLRTEINRVAEPIGPNFVMMTPSARIRLSTGTDTYDDPISQGGTGLGSKAVMTPTELVVSCDVYGPDAANLAQIMTTLLRDDVAFEAMDASGLDMQLLFAEDANQIPFVNGEQQIEFRWTFEVHLQINPVVTVEQDFADTVVTGVISVDVEYPPT